ncbi:hypothetical protein Poly24_44910 [Rosistilla carotiformis]|uniref:Uncharacterized protein n=1 Tax=Rosistilla carotiformis TaxID=2528017 RepID=A0A518JZ12_9BACT|nr:hypothetical protein Poly24_44910 [Rosistilla carotiformis]
MGEVDAEKMPGSIPPWVMVRVTGPLGLRSESTGKASGTLHSKQSPPEVHEFYVCATGYARAAFPNSRENGPPDIDTSMGEVDR